MDISTTARPTPESGAISREKRALPKADKYIWGIYLFLLVFSLIELYSASSREVTAANVFAPVLRHGKMLLIGLGITLGLSRVRFKWLVPATPVFVAFAVAIGVYVLFKGQIINGARRSMSLLGIPLQSAELLKLAVVLFIAFVMSRTQERNGVKNSGIIISAGFVLLCGAILFSQGLTNTLLLMGISFAMMLIAGVQTKKFIIVLVCYGVLAWAGQSYKHSHEEPESQAETEAILTTGHDLQGNIATHDRKETWLARLERWWGDSIPKYQQKIDAKNRQEMYSYMAQANGGWHGVLPGNSRETARLPLAFSDYIFAIIVEDWGFLGAVFLLVIYLALLGRAGAIAARCTKVFPALLVMGMAVMIVLQALFHMAIVTGVFPVSGQPLPLISKGGSSIICTSIAFGIMLSVSRFAGQKKKMKKNAETESAVQEELPDNMTAPNPTQL